MLHFYNELKDLVTETEEISIKKSMILSKMLALMIK